MRGSEGTKRTLPDKLGVRPGHSIVLLGAPRGYRALLDRPGVSATFSSRLVSDADLVQVFARHAAELRVALPGIKASVKPDGMVWVSWPKLSSGLRTDLSDSVVREIGLANGLVDVKVCAIDDEWSGLKFVRRRLDRR